MVTGIHFLTEAFHSCSEIFLFRGKKKSFLPVFPIHGLHCQNIRLNVHLAICQVLMILNMQ